MFESDDWDFDQDFLKDIDDKTVKYCSQKDDQENKSKRRKIEITNNDVNSKTGKAVNETIVKYVEEKELRKNLVLEIFNKNLPDKDISQDVLSDPKRSCDNISINTHANHVKSCENNHLPRKNLVLEILKNKNAQYKTLANNRNNVKLITESSININAKQEYTISNDNKKHIISKNNCNIENRSSNDNSKYHSSENSRKQLLCNILKQKSIDNTEFKSDSSKSNPPTIKHLQIQSNKKMTLVRKFPGPAGLLPDDIDSNIPCASYLNSLEECETSEETDSNDLSEYCSQNTKNLFTEGAWQLMLNDLPHDFLKGHNIATVKQTATTNGFNGTKIKFLAGIIEHIDYNHDNPPIILKDFTDNIQGIVHRDIPLKYPGLLESNVVVLLHDVGLLKTSGTFVSNKYQILIFPSSLLAIYTNKGTIERTRYMETVLENISDERTKIKERKKENYVSIKPLEVHPTKNCVQLKSNNNNRESINFGKNIKKTNEKDLTVINLNETDETTSQSIHSDISFSVSPINITNSQNQKNFNYSMPKNSKCVEPESKNQNLKQSLIKEKGERNQQNDEEKAKNVLKDLKQFASDSNEKKHFFHNPKILHENTNQLVPISTDSKETESEILNDIFLDKMDIDECDIDMFPNKTKSIKETVYPPCHNIIRNDQEESTHSIRSKLLQFKSVDALTPPKNSTSTVSLSLEEKHEELPKMKLSKITSVHGTVGNTETDTDDEMLSQLDMDIIFSNYNNKS